MGCGNTREKIENEIIAIKLERVGIQMDRKNEIKLLEEIEGRKIEEPNIPDYIAGNPNQIVKENNPSIKSKISSKKKKIRSKSVDIKKKNKQLKMNTQALENKNKNNVKNKNRIKRPTK